MTTPPDMAASEPSSTASSPTMQDRDDRSASPPTFALPKPITNNIRFNQHQPRPSSTITSIPEDAVVDIQSPTEEMGQAESHHDIKATLTDLLNCESVKRDAKTRLWVQTRLMEAEMELKRQRRRRVGSRIGSPVSPGE